MSKKLDDFRRQIDRIDDQIHDLLIERANVVLEIAEEKKKSGGSKIQPAREAVMIRRLVERHHGALPKEAIVGIWRELVGALGALQTDISIGVSAAEYEEYCWDSAKDYFGSTLPMARYSSPLSALSALREDEITFAVLPWPQDENGPHVWWPNLVNQDHRNNPMRIVIGLPHCGEFPYKEVHQRALVVAKKDFNQSGHDNSFLALEISSTVSRARIVDVLKNNGLTALSMTSRTAPELHGDSLHLLEVEGFVGAEDERLGKLAESFDGQNVFCICLGGYPVPLVLKNEQRNSQPKRAAN